MGANMIQKKDFIKIVEEIKHYDDELDKLQNVNSSLCLAFVEKYDLKDILILTLELALGLKVNPQFGSTLSWWIYETKYGNKNYTITIGKKKIHLDTIEKLWNYLVKYEIKK